MLPAVRVMMATVAAGPPETAAGENKTAMWTWDGDKTNPLVVLGVGEVCAESAAISGNAGELGESPPGGEHAGAVDEGAKLHKPGWCRPVALNRQQDREVRSAIQ